MCVHVCMNVYTVCVCVHLVPQRPEEGRRSSGNGIADTWARPMWVLVNEPGVSSRVTSAPHA